MLSLATYPSVPLRRSREKQEEGQAAGLPAADPRARGSVDTAHRAQQNAGEAFRYAVATC